MQTSAIFQLYCGINIYQWYVVSEKWIIFLILEKLGPNYVSSGFFRG
jgi:hypothetical protein